VSLIPGILKNFLISTLPLTLLTFQIMDSNNNTRFIAKIEKLLVTKKLGKFTQSNLKANQAE